MKKSLIMAAVLTAVCASFALAVERGDEVDIKADDICVLDYVNTATGSIRIGEAVLRAGGRFRADAPIHWDSDMESLKARNMRTGEVLRFCAREFSADIRSAFVKRVGTYTKGVNDAAKALTGTFYMVDDTLRIRSGLSLGADSGLVLEGIPGGVRMDFPYDDETGELVLWRQLLESRGFTVDAKTPLRFHLEHVVRTDGGDVTVTPLTDGFMVGFVPSF